MNEIEGIVALIVVGLTAFVSYRAFKDRRLMDSLLFIPERIIQHGEWHRLVSSALIHADFPHLLFNMFSLYSFGSAVEMAYGPWVLLTIYMASILGGGLLSLFLHRQNSTYRALGASGGVCGVIFASIFLLPGGGVIVFPLPIAIPSWLYAILFILVSFIGMRRKAGNIGHDAHIGGALCGLAVATAIYPEIIRQSPLLYSAVLVISVVLFAYVYRIPLSSSTVSRVASPQGREVGGGSVRRRREKEDVDQLLAKVSEHGLDALSASERKRLKSLATRRKR